MTTMNPSPPGLRRFTKLSGIPFLLAITMLLSLAMTATAGEPEDTMGQDVEAHAHAHMALEPPDWDAARAAFTVAAEQGSPTAMSYLGWMYEEGHGVVREVPRRRSGMAARRARGPTTSL